MKENTIQCNFENNLTKFSGENDTNKVKNVQSELQN